jgi:hypothetical protein
MEYAIASPAARAADADIHMTSLSICRVSRSVSGDTDKASFSTFFIDRYMGPKTNATRKNGMKTARLS